MNFYQILPITTPEKTRGRFFYYYIITNYVKLLPINTHFFSFLPLLPLLQIVEFQHYYLLLPITYRCIIGTNTY